MTPLLSSSTIEIIKSTSELYNNVKFNKLIVFNNFTSSSCKNDFQLIGSINLSSCQPLNEEFCNNILRSLEFTLTNDTNKSQNEKEKEKETTTTTSASSSSCNRVIYFRTNDDDHNDENYRMIGHFINNFIIIYILSD